MNRRVVETYNVNYEKPKRVFKIIVIGDTNVGKTCLTYRFCTGKFPEKPEATIGVDFREKNVTTEGEQIKVHILSHFVYTFIVLTNVFLKFPLLTYRSASQQAPLQLQ